MEKYFSTDSNQLDLFCNNCGCDDQDSLIKNSSNEVICGNCGHVE